MEVGEKGKRRVSWDFNKGGPKCFIWVPWGTGKIDSKPAVGLGPNPTLT